MATKTVFFWFGTVCSGMPITVLLYSNPNLGNTGPGIHTIAASGSRKKVETCRQKIAQKKTCSVQNVRVL